jgi:hypothetical protein
MEVSGKIKLINDTQEFGKSGFKKRETVIVTQEQYPQPLMVEFVQDKTSLLDSFSPGDMVTIQINLRGREWTSPQGETKYFNSIQGWRIEKVKDQAKEEFSKNEAPSDDDLVPGNADDDLDGDLPF